MLFRSTFALPYLFTPLTDTMAILIGSLVLGLSLIHILTILPTGDVYACRRVQNSKVGNVFNDRLADLWVCQVEQYRDYARFERCAKCELLAWCRGCPAVASGRDGSFYAADPQCWKEIG